MEDTLKKLIREAINSNPRAKKKADALKSRKLGEILECYRDCCNEYANNLHESVRDYAKEKFLLRDILVKPERTRDTLKAWLRGEVWCDAVKKFKGDRKSVV